LIASKWFKDRWGHKCQLTRDINTKTRFANVQSGYRIATSIGGTTTGEHVDYEFFDDPNNTANVESEVTRADTNIKFDRVFSGRFNDPNTGRLALIQQRTHSQDLSGHLLAKNIPDLVHLCLPQEYETNRPCVTIPLKSTNGKPWKDPRKEEGELLWPEFFNEKAVEQGKRDLGDRYAIAGQYQQRPSPAEGGIFKKSDFQWWKEPAPPRCHFILQSWDTAFSTSSHAAWSACTTWGLFNHRDNPNNIILLSLWRGKLENPDVRRMMLRLSKNYYDTRMEYPAPEDHICKPDMILIEGKANGTPLLQDLRRAGLIINSFDPNKHGGGDKTARARAVSNLIEAGCVWMPAKPPLYDKLRPHADLFVEACASFPNDVNSRDLVDSMSQALIKFRLQGMIGHPDDAYIMEEYNPNKGKKLY
jgi:predicted phage terminase large subunit-like protein